MNHSTVEIETRYRSEERRKRDNRVTAPVTKGVNVRQQLLVGTVNAVD